jgi:hypothetical protein
VLPKDVTAVNEFQLYGRKQTRHIYSKRRQSQQTASGFGGLEVACWSLVTKFAGSNPVEAVGFLERKNPQHAFLRRGSKAVGPMSLLYGM